MSSFSADTEPTGKLPLWRTIAGFSVLGSLVVILFSLIPAYVEDHRLGQFVSSLAAQSDARMAPDQQLEQEVYTRAKELDLKLQPGDVHVDRSGGKLRLQVAKHKAQVLGHFDLHFPATVSR